MATVLQEAFRRLDGEISRVRRELAHTPWYRPKLKVKRAKRLALLEGVRALLAQDRSNIEEHNWGVFSRDTARVYLSQFNPGNHEHVGVLARIMEEGT